MRKFTKEITALIASAAVCTVAGVGAFSASSEESELPPVDGGLLLSDEWIEPTPEPTPEPTLPPLAGDPLPSDEWIEPTPEPTPEPTIPPLAGEPLPPDEWIEPTEPTTEEELPPIMGGIAPMDGDINSDGSFDAADVALFQKWLLNEPGVTIEYWPAADLCADGTLDAYDLSLMKRKLLEKNPESSRDGQPLSDIQAMRAEDISQVMLTVNPPVKTVQLSREQIEEMLTRLKDVTVYEEDNSYVEYDGQWVEFAMTLNDGKEMSIAVYNPFFIVNRVGYQADYESCEALNAFANSIISE